MNRIVRFLAVTASVGAVVLVLSATSAGPALAQTFKPLMSFIINDAAHPVPVVDVRTAEPFQQFVRSIDSEFNVPEGKRLVMEFYSGTASSVSTCTVRAMRIRTLLTTASDPLIHSLIPVLTATAPTFNGYTISQQVRLFAGPGTLVSFGMITTPDDCVADFLGVVSGYLVNVE